MRLYPCSCVVSRAASGAGPRLSRRQAGWPRSPGGRTPRCGIPSTELPSLMRTIAIDRPDLVCPCASRASRHLQYLPGQSVHEPALHPVAAGPGVRISMDGRGRWMGNVLIERLWRSLNRGAAKRNTSTSTSMLSMPVSRLGPVLEGGSLAALERDPVWLSAAQRRRRSIRPGIESRWRLSAKQSQA